jgi:hypothetical protein
MKEALELKKEGNDHFRNQGVVFHSGCYSLPSSTTIFNHHPQPSSSKHQIHGGDCLVLLEYVEGKDLYTKAIKRCPKEFKENKSIFHANRAACFQKLVGSSNQCIIHYQLMHLLLYIITCYDSFCSS